MCQLIELDVRSKVLPAEGDIWGRGVYASHRGGGGEEGRRGKTCWWTEILLEVNHDEGGPEGERHRGTVQLLLEKLGVFA
jgi:hypothetical protein